MWVGSTNLHRLYLGRLCPNTARLPTFGELMPLIVFILISIIFSDLAVSKGSIYETLNKDPGYTDRHSMLIVDIATKEKKLDQDYKKFGDNLKKISSVHARLEELWMLKLQKEFTNNEQKYFLTLFNHHLIKKYFKFQKDFLVDKNIKAEIQKEVMLMKSPQKNVNAPAKK